jgi:hypothetical protein
LRLRLQLVPLVTETVFIILSREKVLAQERQEGNAQGFAGQADRLIVPIVPVPCHDGADAMLLHDVFHEFETDGAREFPDFRNVGSGRIGIVGLLLHVLGHPAGLGLGDVEVRKDVPIDAARQGLQDLDIRRELEAADTNDGRTFSHERAGRLTKLHKGDRPKRRSARRRRHRLTSAFRNRKITAAAADFRHAASGT